MKTQSSTLYLLFALVLHVYYVTLHSELAANIHWLPLDAVSPSAILIYEMSMYERTVLCSGGHVLFKLCHSDMLHVSAAAAEYTLIAAGYFSLARNCKIFFPPPQLAGLLSSASAQPGDRAACPWRVDMHST